MANTMGPPLNLATKEQAAAAIINGGTDLEMGTDIFNSSMLSAVAKGLVTPDTVTTAARRGLLARMTQGDFDPVAEVRSWFYIGRGGCVVAMGQHEVPIYCCIRRMDSLVYTAVSVVWIVYFSVNLTTTRVYLRYWVVKGEGGPVVEWASIGKDVVNSTEHQQAAYVTILSVRALALFRDVLTSAF